MHFMWTSFHPFPPHLTLLLLCFWSMMLLGVLPSQIFFIFAHRSVCWHPLIFLAGFFSPRTQKTMLGLKSSRSLNPQIIKPNFWNVRTSSFNFEICYDSSGANRSCLHMTALSYTELSSLILIWTPWTTYFWRLIKAKHLNYLKSLLH